MRGHRFCGVPTTPRGKDFSYLRYSLAKSRVNGYECFEACFSLKFGLKSFELSGENSYLCGREQCHPRVSLFM